MNLIGGESRCRACCSSEINELQEYKDLTRITSDCRPLKGRGRLFYCSQCGLVQKILTTHLRQEIREIYESYETYKDDIEPMVFSSDVKENRSNRIFHEIEKMLDTDSRGTHIDIGCGDGSFLKVFSNYRPEWHLYGFDVNKRRITEIEDICGKGQFITGSLENIPDEVDLITMIYVLEHIDQVKTVMEVLLDKLSQDGKLIAIVPDLDKNPYDIVVGDHLSHYTEETLRTQLQNFEIIEVRNFLQKELIVFAQKKIEESYPIIEFSNRRTRIGEESIEHLLKVRSHARMSFTDSKLFGIFGTAIAGTWLSAELCHADHFFVDENTEKHGQLHLGKEVLAPGDSPDGAKIYLPFDAKTRASIKERLKNLINVTFIGPGLK